MATLTIMVEQITAGTRELWEGAGTQIVDEFRIDRPVHEYKSVYICRKFVI